MIREVEKKDIPQITAIYNHYVRESIATFDTVEREVEEMEKKLMDIAASYPFLVYEQEGTIHAYAYASQWKIRKAYDQTVESSIYMAPGSEGKGIGTELYAALMEELKKTDIHTVLGGISVPNPASIALHKKLGFTESGTLKEVGLKFGKRIDVCYYQLYL